MLRTRPFRTNPHLYSCDFSILSCLSHFFFRRLWGSVNNTFIYIISHLTGVECIFHKNGIQSDARKTTHVYIYTFMRVIHGSVATVTYTPPPLLSVFPPTLCTLQRPHPLIIYDLLPLWRLRVVYYIIQETVRIQKTIGCIHTECQNVYLGFPPPSRHHPRRSVLVILVPPTLIPWYNNTWRWYVLIYSQKRLSRSWRGCL